MKFFLPSENKQPVIPNSLASKDTLLSHDMFGEMNSSPSI